MTWEDRQRERRLKRAQRREMARSTDAIIDYLAHVTMHSTIADCSMQTDFEHTPHNSEPTKH